MFWEQKLPFFNVEALREPWIKSESYQSMIKKLTAEKVTFQRALPR